MSTPSILDRESFQKLLASAFAVQESHIDTQSLSAMVEVHRLISSGDFDVDGAMRLIGDRTRNVAKATGVAIGLLKGDQLVYRAGSGSADPYIERHVIAIVSVLAQNDAGGEILRVENAQTDERMEAAICRQFGAKSLLILPIYHDRAVAGVLEVLFSEAHAFPDREVHTYRLMAGLAGEAMSHAAPLERKKALAAELSIVPHATEQTTSEMQKFRGDDKSVPGPAHKHAISRGYGAAMARAGELPGLWQRAKATAMIMQRVKRVPLNKLRWNVAVAAVPALMMACLIASDHPPASPLGAPAVARSNAPDQQASFVPAKPVPANSTSKPQTAAGGTEKAKGAKSAFKRVQVGENEVDYIAEDVTIRYFKPETAPERVRIGDTQVNSGEDGTVGYFAPKPPVVPSTRRLPLRPVPSATQPVDRSLLVSK